VSLYCIVLIIYKVKIAISMNKLISGCIKNTQIPEIFERQAFTKENDIYKYFRQDLSKGQAGFT